MAGGESRRMGRDKATLMVGGEPMWRRQIRTLREAGFAEIMIARGAHEPLGAGEPGLVEVPDAVPGCGPLGGLATGLQRASTGWLLVLAVDLPFMPASFLREMIALTEADECSRGLAVTMQKARRPGWVARASRLFGSASRRVVDAARGLQQKVRTCASGAAGRDARRNRRDACATHGSAARVLHSYGLVPTIDGQHEPLTAIYPTAPASEFATEALRTGSLSLRDFVTKLIALDLMRELEVPATNRDFFRNINTPETSRRSSSDSLRSLIVSLSDCLIVCRSSYPSASSAA